MTDESYNKCLGIISNMTCDEYQKLFENAKGCDENFEQLKSKSDDPNGMKCLLQNNRFEEAFKDILCYDGYDSLLLAIAEDMEKFIEKEKWYMKSDVEVFLEKVILWDTEMQMIWEFLVLIFGNYCSSPRTGWIEDIEGCVTYIRDSFKRENNL